MFNELNFKNKNLQGVIRRVADGVAEIEGINSVKLGEIIVDKFNNFGLVLNLKISVVDAIFLSENNLKAHNIVYKLGYFSNIKVSPFLFGKVLDIFGNILLGDIFFKKFIIKWFPVLNLELKAPSILSRESVYESLSTGLKIVDALIPIGLGQRELIIGDRLTGKTTIAIDTIINQSNNNFEYLKNI